MEFLNCSLILYLGSAVANSKLEVILDIKIGYISIYLVSFYFHTLMSIKFFLDISFCMDFLNILFKAINKIFKK